MPAAAALVRRPPTTRALAPPGGLELRGRSAGTGAIRVGGAARARLQHRWRPAPRCSSARAVGAVGGRLAHRRLHHPDVRAVDDTLAAGLRRDLLPGCGATASKLLLLGHVHAYERTVPVDGMTHVAVGTGGAEIGRARWTTAPLAAAPRPLGALRLDVGPRWRPGPSSRWTASCATVQRALSRVDGGASGSEGSPETLMESHRPGSRRTPC